MDCDKASKSHVSHVVLVDDIDIPESTLIAAEMPVSVDVDGLPTSVSKESFQELQANFSLTNCEQCPLPYLAQNELLWALFVATYQRCQADDYISRCPKECDTVTSLYLQAHQPSREAFLKHLVLPVH